MEDVALAALARGALKIARGEATEVLQQLHRGGTAGGAYPKALVLLHPDGSLSVGDPEPNLTPCLVKFAQPERKGMTQCEHAYAQLAALAGITPASTQLLADGENTHLLVRRFDITAQGGGRKHCHTASGLLHKQPGTLDYRDVFRAILRLGLPREDLREWARRTAFNLLASNADDHGKNHCFLYDAAAGWSLSPAYDMSFAESVLGRGMTIAGEVWPTLSRLTELFMSATLEKEECRMIIEKAIEAVAQWPRVAKTSSVPPEMIKHVQERLARIKQAVLPINV